MIFKDSPLESQLARTGYVTVPLLTPDEIGRLQKIYDLHTPRGQKGFHCTMFNPNFDSRNGIDAGIKEVLSCKVTDLLVDYRMVYGNFMAKEVGEQSDWYVHQDWTYVDEEKHTSIAVWIPLVDLTPENGAITMVPGSHRFKNTVRGPGVTDPFATHHELIRKELGQPVYLKAGEAIIWHHRLLHFSPPNLSKSARIAATVICVPDQCEVYHYWKNPESESAMAERYLVDTDFFMNYEIGKKPASKKDGTDDSFFASPDKNQLERFYREATASKFDILSKMRNRIPFFK